VLEVEREVATPRVRATLRISPAEASVITRLLPP
jgi:hypothetical protein